MNFKDKPIFWLIVAGLATWRITSILHREKIAAPIRRAVGIVPFSEDRPEDDPENWVYPANFIGDLFYCTWCLSMWVGGAVLGILLLFPIGLLPFGLSAIAIWLEQLKDFMEKQQQVWIEVEEEPYDDSDSD